MIELNLLPDVKRELVRAYQVRRRTIAIMILVSIISVGAVVLLALYVYGGQLALGNILNGTIEQKAKELSEKQGINQQLTIQNQLAALPELHDGKLMYSRLFDYLPVVNPAAPNNIRVTRLSTDETQGLITINGYGRDYKAVTIFEDTLKNAQLSYQQDGENKQEPFLKTLTMSQVGLGEDAGGNRVVTFTATLEYAEAAFDRKVSNAKVTVPTRTTTNVGQEVFGEQTAEEGEN
ncbi:MAG TPA: hypothetical protein VD907_05340 [Verrucomicrobiae bacterium]|nr:hypothetical protein [Verrucomicrobiae bacterium]